MAFDIRSTPTTDTHHAMTLLNGVAEGLKSNKPGEECDSLVTIALSDTGLYSDQVEETSYRSRIRLL